MNTLPVIGIVMALAEVSGALIFLKTKSTVKRVSLACFGLGFAAMIVLMDILPEATDGYPYGFLMCVLGGLLVYWIDRYGRSIGGYAAVSGMGVHNLCEGIILTALGSGISPVVAAALLLHKFPEGVVSLSLLKNSKYRMSIVAFISLLIPLGAFVAVPGYIEHPVLAFGSGVILFVVSSSLARILSEHYSYAMPAAIGAMLGVATCLLI